MFAIVLAALDRSGSVLPILCAMAVHELAHVVMMLACGGQVRRLTLRFADLQIAASGLGYRQELLSALAGPLVNLICGAAFCMQRPSFAAYSLMLGIYNLLPVWPLDGGRMIRCVLLARLPITQAEHISEIVSFAACAVLLLIGVPIAFSLGIAALMTVVGAGTLPVSYIASVAFTSIDNFPIMAIPFFIAAGCSWVRAAFPAACCPWPMNWWAALPAAWPSPASPPACSSRPSAVPARPRWRPSAP